MNLYSPLSYPSGSVEFSFMKKTIVMRILQFNQKKNFEFKSTSCQFHFVVEV